MQCLVVYWQHSKSFMTIAVRDRFTENFPEKWLGAGGRKFGFRRFKDLATFTAHSIYCLQKLTWLS